MHEPSRSARALLLVLLFASSLAICTAQAKLEAGLAAVDITPPEWPVTLRGSFSPKKTESAHDPLHARSLALRNGDGRVVITVVDILYIDQETQDEIKAAAAEATGWSPQEFLISGTHTHSAPSAGGDSQEPAEVAFRKRAAEGIVTAITTAIENLEPARVGFGSADEPSEVYNRRWYLQEGKMPPNPFGEIDKVKMNPPRDLIVEPAGPIDPEVCVVSIQNAKGKPLGLLANYSLHYVGNVPGRLVSADYYGEFARLAPYRIAGRNPPGNFVAIMSNGTSGDINNIDFEGKRAPRAPFEQITQVATKTADAAWTATRDIEYDSNPAIGIRERRITLNYRKPSPELIEESEKILKMSEEELKEKPRLAIHYAARALRLAEGPDSDEVAIQAIRIGDQAILALPFEVLVEIGLDLKERSPFPHTFTIELANGAFGYLPPPNQHDLGGYETWLGTNRVQKDASVILTDNLLEMLEELKALK